MSISSRSMRRSQLKSTGMGRNAYYMSLSLSEMIRLVSNTKEAARKGIDMSTFASWCHADLGINCYNNCFPIFYFSDIKHRLATWGHIICAARTRIA